MWAAVSSSGRQPPPPYIIHGRQGAAWQVRFVVVDAYACVCERRDLSRSPGGLRALAALPQLPGRKLMIAQEGTPLPLTALSQHLGRCY